jgi:hypothetical protein
MARNVLESVWKEAVLLSRQLSAVRMLSVCGGNRNKTSRVKNEVDHRIISRVEGRELSYTVQLAGWLEEGCN